MKETVFNLFVFVEYEYIRRLGAVAHEVEGSDSEKIAYLRAKAASDAGIADQQEVPSRYTFRQGDGTYAPGLNYRSFQQMTFGGRLFEVFDEAMDGLGALSQPLVVVTPIVDGVARVDQVGDLPAGPPPADKVVVNRFPICDYFAKYLTREGFDLPRLLNDDHFRAIKSLYNGRLFVSSAKLLMSFVDTISYLHEGDRPGNFQRWLNCFVDLPATGVTADELWEFRNSVLHMTNTDSRKVIAGRVRRLSFYVRTLPSGFAAEDADAKYFDLHGLIFAITDGLEKWIDSFNREPAKWAEFFERYDRILSDVRYEVLSHAGPETQTSTFHEGVEN